METSYILGDECLEKVPCPDNCIECQDDGECLTCDKGYYFFKFIRQCRPCQTGCVECSGRSSCDVCMDGYLLNSRNSCIECDLASNYVEDGQCKPIIQCPENCPECTRDGICLSCAERFFLDTDLNSCVQCTDNCLQCTSSEVCDLC